MTVVPVKVKSEAVSCFSSIWREAMQINSVSAALGWSLRDTHHEQSEIQC